MPKSPLAPLALSKAQARRLWLAAQRLDSAAPFGAGPAATPAAVEHLGYVQIDTINVIERCHHHILWSRIPDYRREHLQAAQSIDKTVFEYWTHALAYVPTRDIAAFLPAMKRHRQAPKTWLGPVTSAEVRKVIARVREGGPLTIRDIDDDILVDKTHPWASRKPSRRALQVAFYTGALTVSARAGMLKTYELTGRHFGWETPPRPATERQVLEYMLDRALRAQGLVSLDSICHLDAPRKAPIRALIEARVRARRLRAVGVDGVAAEHWAEPAGLQAVAPPAEPVVHILSPFDPLVIQRRRLKALFDYDHRFEAYVPKEKRRHGYFALPVLVGDAVVAAIDVKTDRQAATLRLQQWTWVGTGGPADKPAIEEALGRFERFQLQVDGGAQGTGAVAAGEPGANAPAATST